MPLFASSLYGTFQHLELDIRAEVWDSVVAWLLFIFQSRYVVSLEPTVSSPSPCGQPRGKSLNCFKGLWVLSDQHFRRRYSHTHHKILFTKPKLTGVAFSSHTGCLLWNSPLYLFFDWLQYCKFPCVFYVTF